MTHEIAQIGPEAGAPREIWTTPVLRALRVSESELGVGATVDAEGHS